MPFNLTVGGDSLRNLGSAEISGYGNSDRSFASLQNPIAQNAQFAGPSSVQLPSWMNTNPDANLQELIQSYQGVGSAFDPTEQVKARNDAIGYNTSAGSQAANNAATEYSNRAAQSGASGLGAGVVKAQAMMPVYAQNAKLKTEAADVAAKTKQEGLSLAGQIASTIGNLRTSYLKSLADYSSGQQQMMNQTNQFNSNLALQNYQAQLEGSKLKLQESDQARLAASELLRMNGPSGMVITDNLGRITSGQDSYNQLQNWGQARAQATSALRGMLPGY